MRTKSSLLRQVLKRVRSYQKWHASELDTEDAVLEDLTEMLKGYKKFKK